MATPTVGRLRRQRTFRALRRPDGRAARGPLRVAYVGPGTGEPAGSAQVGYAISGRCGNAVTRNRLRRRLRAAAAAHARTTGLVPGAYLVRTEPAATTLAYAELARLLDAALDAAAGSR